MKLRIFNILTLFLIAISTIAQIKAPVAFFVDTKQVGEKQMEIVFNGRIDNGWHVYSTLQSPDGPIQATINLEDSKNVKLIGKLKGVGREIKAFDENFNMEVRYFEHSVRFVQRVQLTADEYILKGYLQFGACNEESCLPPQSIEFNFDGKVETVAKDEQNKDSVEGIADCSAVSVSDSSAIKSNLWTPVFGKLNKSSSVTDNIDGKSSSLLTIFLLGFLGGLVALLTPCVWPIIPMTVSFFLKRSSNKNKAVRDALIYGLSIIIIYMFLAVVVTILFGANQLNALSTNAYVNLFFFLLLVVFGLSFLGLFDLTLPASWTSAVDNKAENTSGLLSIFLMAFTLALVSFSCTGPIVGFLLVEVATTGELLAPSVGMFGFAVALALPFTFFALFPTLLKQAPKSGSWMVLVKIVLGFIELAFALKFLSVADMAYGWNFLSRDIFIAIWIILFAWLALFLFGLVKIPYDHCGKVAISKVRIALGIVLVCFIGYMIPGLWGAPVKAISAFTPPMSTQKWKLYDNEIKATATDYEEGMKLAKEAHKPVLLDFTGLGCVNCRKMEASVWTYPQVRELIENNFVLIELYVDNKQPLPEKLSVSEADGSTTTLRTVGDRWSYLQRYKFGSNAQPFYVLVDNEGNPLNGSYGYDENIDKFIEFLKIGINSYNKKEN